MSAVIVNVRCNQNSLFGCGRIMPLEGETYIIGVSRQRVMAGGRCECGLPLAVVRDFRERVTA